MASIIWLYAVPAFHSGAASIPLNIPQHAGQPFINGYFAELCSQLCACFGSDGSAGRPKPGFVFQLSRCFDALLKVCIVSRQFQSAGLKPSDRKIINFCTSDIQ
jgi:hypothetical protein